MGAWPGYGRHYQNPKTAAHSRADHSGGLSQDQRTHRQVNPPAVVLIPPTGAPVLENVLFKALGVVTLLSGVKFSLTDIYDLEGDYTLVITSDVDAIDATAGDSGVVVSSTPGSANATLVGTLDELNAFLFGSTTATLTIETTVAGDYALQMSITAPDEAVSTTVFEVRIPLTVIGLEDQDYGDITVSNDGQTWTIDPGVAKLALTASKTANYTAVAGDLVNCDVATTGSFTVTLPTTPATNDEVGVLLNVADVPRTVTISNTLSGTPKIIGKHGDEGAAIELFIEGDFVRLKYLGSSVWLLVDDQRIAHYCDVSGDDTTGQSLTSSLAATADLTITDADNAGLADLTANNVTIRRPGQYLVQYGFALTSSSVLQNMRVNIFLDGASHRFQGVLINTTLSQPVNAVGSSIVDLVEGSVLHVTLFQISSDASAKTVGITAATRSRLVVKELR